MPAEPYRISPVDRQLAALGARWTMLRGWRVAVTVDPQPESPNGLYDLSDYAKVEIRGSELERLPLSDAGLPAPRSGRELGRAVLYRFTAEQLLVCAPAESELPALEAVGCAHRTDRTSGLACFLLAGPHAAGILNRLTSLDLREDRFPNLACARAPVARVNGWIARRDRRQARAYEIYCGREYGEYLWGAIREAGRHAGLAVRGRMGLGMLEV